jgi:hypothetical protein
MRIGFRASLNFPSPPKVQHFSATAISRRTRTYATTCAKNIRQYRYISTTLYNILVFTFYAIDKHIKHLPTGHLEQLSSSQPLIFHFYRTTTRSGGLQGLNNHRTGTIPSPPKQPRRAQARTTSSVCLSFHQLAKDPDAEIVNGYDTNVH